MKGRITQVLDSKFKSGCGRNARKHGYSTGDIISD